MVKPNKQLRELLLKVYAPCPGFSGACNGAMKWIPEKGYVPRGFCGATGSIDGVKLILVVAEPGDPHDSEKHIGSPDQKFDSAFSYAYGCYETRKNPFHKKIREILDLFFPNQSFVEQMKQTFITESVLCSAPIESGKITPEVEHECRNQYLEKELSLFPNAFVVALGQKASDRMKRIGMYFQAFAAAPPGCNLEGAKESWEEAAKIFHKQISTNIYPFTNH